MPVHFAWGARAGVLGRVADRPARVLALLSLAVVTTGCHVGPGASAPSVSGQLTVAVVPGIDTAPLLIGVDEGLFAQHGIGVIVKDYPSVTAAYKAIQDGSADVAAGDYTSFFYSIATGQASLTLIADGYDAASGTIQVLTLPGAITSPQDLVGKVVAAPEAQVAPDSIETLAGQSVLQSDGVNPAQVTWQQLPQNEMINSLENHRVSAILATDPLIIQAQTQLGAVELLDASSGVAANMPLSGYFSTTAFARKDGAALRAFKAGLSSAQAAAGLRSKVQSVLINEHMSTLEAALANIGQYPTFVNIGQVQRVADLMYDTGMIASPISVNSLLLR
jgi:NitT/TauT family transport system substrate-binding protein